MCYGIKNYCIQSTKCIFNVPFSLETFHCTIPLKKAKHLLKLQFPLPFVNWTKSINHHSSLGLHSASPTISLNKHQTAHGGFHHKIPLLPVVFRQSFTKCIPWYFTSPHATAHGSFATTNAIVISHINQPAKVCAFQPAHTHTQRDTNLESNSSPHQLLPDTESKLSSSSQSQGTRPQKQFPNKSTA